MTKKKGNIPATHKTLFDQLVLESGGPQPWFDKGGLLDNLKKLCCAPGSGIARKSNQHD